jgi:hypothetical protein
LIYTFFVLQIVSSIAVCNLMTKTTETLERIEPQFGAIYESLKYSENNWFARFFPVWFMLKRYAFIGMVFNMSNTQGMLVISLYANLIELCLVASYLPYSDSITNKIEMFNLTFAYTFLLLI